MTPTTIRLNDEDDDVVDALQKHTGIASRTDVVRLALRETARAKGIDLDAIKPKEPQQPPKRSKK